MYSLENALALWNEAAGIESSEVRLERERRWLPYYSFLADKAMHRPYRENANARLIAEFMSREDILRQGDRLLDVGAGMGGHSLSFSDYCSTVTALDINRDCLSVLQRNAGIAGKDNVVLQNTPWELYQNEEQYDVVFSAMCPAICNQEELLRFESMAKRTACILTVTRGSYEHRRMELMKLIPHEKPKGMVTEALHYFNVLYLMGRQPNIKTWSSRYESCSAIEDLIAQYAVYFEIFGVNQAVSIPIITECFNTVSENGFVKDECRMNTALIYWNVPKEA